jgi:hypothetical protein
MESDPRKLERARLEGLARAWSSGSGRRRPRDCSAGRRSAASARGRLTAGSYGSTPLCRRPCAWARYATQPEDAA